MIRQGSMRSQHHSLSLTASFPQITMMAWCLEASLQQEEKEKALTTTKKKSDQGLSSQQQEAKEEALPLSIPSLSRHVPAHARPCSSSSLQQGGSLL